MIFDWVDARVVVGTVQEEEGSGVKTSKLYVEGGSGSGAIQNCSGGGVDDSSQVMEVVEEEGGNDSIQLVVVPAGHKFQQTRR